MPSIKQLEMQEGVRVKHIEQTYLVSDMGKSARVRKIDEDGKIKFVKTVKERISVLSAYENEFEISEDTYIKELEHLDINKKPSLRQDFAFPLTIISLRSTYTRFGTTVRYLRSSCQTRVRAFPCPLLFVSLRRFPRTSDIKIQSLRKVYRWMIYQWYNRKRQLNVIIFLIPLSIHFQKNVVLSMM